MLIDKRTFLLLPEEIALRLLERAIERAGDEGPVELGKLEALYRAMLYFVSSGHFRRSLAGAIVTLAANEITVERAPPRRAKALTTRRRGNAKPTKSR